MRYHRYLLISLAIIGVYFTFPMVFMEGERDLVIYESEWEECLGLKREWEGHRVDWGLLDKEREGARLTAAELEKLAIDKDVMQRTGEGLYRNDSCWMFPLRYLPIERNRALGCQKRTFVHDMYSWMQDVNYTGNKYAFWVIASCFWALWTAYLVLVVIGSRRRRNRGGTEPDPVARTGANRIRGEDGPV